MGSEMCIRDRFKAGDTVFVTLGEDRNIVLTTHTPEGKSEVAEILQG